MKRVIRENHGYVTPGQDLVMAGLAGFKGSRILADKKRVRLLQRFAGDYLDRRLRKEVKINEDWGSGTWEAMGATEWEPVLEGGVLAALWNITGAYRLGMEVRLRDIPIAQVTVEICEHFNINPYRLLTDGMLLVSNHGNDLVRNLSKERIPAAVIGKIWAGNQCLIDNGERSSFLDRPAEDELITMGIPY